MGEALVQKYFQYAGWVARPAGVETTPAHVFARPSFSTGDLSALPDLLVTKVAGSPMNPRTRPLGQAFYVEVKTWSQWHDSNMDVYGKFGSVLLVWVGPMGLRGAWLSAPPGEMGARRVDDTTRVTESDFRPLHGVGAVHLRHCRSPACEERLRDRFDRMAMALANGFP